MTNVSGSGLWWLSIITSSMIIIVVFVTMAPALDALIDNVRGTDNNELPDDSKGAQVIERMSNMFNLSFLLLISLLVLYGIVRVLKLEPQSRYYEV